MNIQSALSLVLSSLLICIVASTANGQPFERTWYLGAEAHPTTKGYEIRSVTPGSPAYKANLRPGDFIKSVNCIEVGYIGNGSYYPLTLAFNKSDGTVKLLVHFVTTQRVFRKYEPTVELVKRGTTTYSMSGRPSIVVTSKDVVVKKDESTESTAEAQSATTREPLDINGILNKSLPEDGRPNRDERGEIDESQYNPTSPDADLDTDPSENSTESE